jgi:hypothetical protein
MDGHNGHENDEPDAQKREKPSAQYIVGDGSEKPDKSHHYEQNHDCDTYD